MKKKSKKEPFDRSMLDYDTIRNHGQGCPSDCQCRIIKYYVLPDVMALGDYNLSCKFNPPTCCQIKLPSCQHHFSYERNKMNIESKLELLDYIQDKIRTNLEQIDTYLTDINTTLEDIKALLGAKSDRTSKNN